MFLSDQISIKEKQILVEDWNRNDNQQVPMVASEIFSKSSFAFISPTKALIGEDIGDGHLYRIEDALSQYSSLLNSAKNESNAILVGAFPFANDHPGIIWCPRKISWMDRASLFAKWEPEEQNIQGIETIPKAKNITECPEGSAYTAAVLTARNKISLGDLTKVVLSRALSIEFDRELDTFGVMRRLASLNHNSYTFHVPVPFSTEDLAENAVLVGSSPELLIRKTGNKVFTNPLAGTKKRSLDPIEDASIAADLLLSSKDLYEHKLVVQSVIECLQPYCKTLTTSSSPQLISTPKLWHLSTVIEGELWDSGTSSLELAKALHPTPAVCGAPREIARTLIGELEGMDRGFFSGLVGWCDMHGDGEWAVSIRCALIQKTLAKLYAGAGVVAQSDPTSELRETSAKLETMLVALGISL